MKHFVRFSFTFLNHFSQPVSKLDDRFDYDISAFSLASSVAFISLLFLDTTVIKALHFTFKNS